MTRFLSAVAVLLLGSALAVAQDPQLPGSFFGQLRVPVHRADEGAAAETWAAGGAYKVSFHDGMTFVPYLGADYPHNQPWSWRTTSVRVGGSELLDGAAPRHVSGDYRYEYQHGAVTEAYDVLEQGLEQTFVVHERPARGDLVITGALTSSLQSESVEAGHRELVFRDSEGRAIVGYGRAIAFDASGDRVPVTTSHHEGVLTLTVPGDWLAQAAMPVTVDPLLTNVLIHSSAAALQVRDIDIAVVPDNPSFQYPVMVVFTRATSDFDDDVYAVVCRVGFSDPRVVHSKLSTSIDSDEPSCSHFENYGFWAVAYRNYYPTAGIRVSRVGCHMRLVTSTAFSSSWVQVPIVPAGHNDARPELGGMGNGSPLDPRVLLVFQREDNSNTAGHMADTNSTAVYTATCSALYQIIGPSTLLRGGSNLDVQNPTASRDWMCAYQVYDYSSSPRWHVEARRVAQSGSQTSIGIWTSSFAPASPHHELRAVVEGEGGRYGVTFNTTDVATTGKNNSLVGKQVQFERIDWPMGQGSPNPNSPPTQIASNANKVLDATAVAFDANDFSHFTIGFRVSSPASLQCVRVGYSGQITEGPLVLHSGTFDSTIACTFDRASDTVLMAYGVNSGVMPVYCQRFPYPTPLPVLVGGPGCSTATISWYGNQQIGAEFNRLHVSDPVLALHFPIVSLVPVSVAVPLPEVPAACALLVDPGAGFMLSAAVGNDILWDFPLPESWLPMTLYFQDWSFDGSQFVSTPRMRVPLVK